MTQERSATERFSALVEDYERYRPGYPAAVFDHLVKQEGLSPDHAIADIGAGTGISTRPLLELGCIVHAVEPNEPMRRAAERRFGDCPNFHAVDGTAEATTLQAGSVHWVLAAQAFHWFDRAAARREFSRILVPGGRVLLLFNERLVTASPFLQAYEEALLQHAIDYAQVNHASLDKAVFDAFFTRYQRHSFSNEQVFDVEGLLGRVRSCSYVPHPGDPGWPALEQTMRHVFDTYQSNNQVSFHYETQLYCGSLTIDDETLPLWTEKLSELPRLVM